MYRVYVAWDVEDAHRFLRVLASHGLHGRLIEDREYPSRGELHDTEGAPEVWISDESQLPQALELASGFEAERNARADASAEPKAEPT